MSNDVPMLGDPLEEEALPPVNESDLVFGAKLPPFPEGTYAVKAKLGKNGLKYDANKRQYTVHAELVIVKVLKVIDPNPSNKPLDKDKLVGKSLHDFFTIKASNLRGIQKVKQFLKYAGDLMYNSPEAYPTTEKLALGLQDALKQEPDEMKVSAQWDASVKFTNAKGEDEWASKRGASKFPKRGDGSIDHIIELADEMVPAQLRVVEYGDITKKDLI